MFKLLDLVEQPQLGDNKQPRNFTEDAYLFTPNLIAIADGVTGKTKESRLIASGASDAQWFVRAFLSSLEEVALKREKSGLDDAREVLRQASEKTIAKYSPVRGANKHDKPACCFSMIMQHIGDKNKFTFVNVGSNYIFYKDQVISASPTLKRMNAELVAEMQAHTDKGGKIRDKSYFRKLREKIFYANTKDSYPLADLSHTWVDHPESIFVTEELQPGEKVMLSTGGLTRSIRYYKTHTETDFFGACLDKGLERMLKEQREIEIDDWDRAKYPRYQPTMDVCTLVAQVE